MLSATQTAPVVIDWGRTRYDDALARQLELVRARIAGEIPDTLVFTEHEPVFTKGVRRESGEHLLWSDGELADRGITVHDTNRGGDITYHGPGQLVCYPILDLSARRDLHAYLRFLEQVLIDSAACFGVTAGRREGKTGIWIADRKLAAIGVAVKKWTTHHGFAFNVDPDLSHFAGIVPCGITDGTVTSLRAELGAACPPIAQVRETIARVFLTAHPEFIAGAPR
ncbi:MAG TPA: lipoyl(octanoyl) transferase LipB [Opitutaceae bacterium]|nr:lipoyl(octanoyl) transferase LipB [Opitutaceae bacterium]